MDDEDTDNDGFFSRIWDKFVEYFIYTLCVIAFLLPYIIGSIIVIICILSELGYITFFNFIR